VARCASVDARAALTESLTRHLAIVNAKLEPHEKLDCLAAICTAWTPENGFVTPTLKVKRMRVEEAYANQYEGWLAQRKPVVWAS
jgi:long-chain acyl-CoA synthetase